MPSSYAIDAVAGRHRHHRHVVVTSSSPQKDSKRSIKITRVQKCDRLAETRVRVRSSAKIIKTTRCKTDQMSRPRRRGATRPATRSAGQAWPCHTWQIPSTSRQVGVQNVQRSRRGVPDAWMYGTMNRSRCTKITGTAGKGDKDHRHQIEFRLITSGQAGSSAGRLAGSKSSKR